MLIFLVYIQETFSLIASCTKPFLSDCLLTYHFFCCGPKSASKPAIDDEISRTVEHGSEQDYRINDTEWFTTRFVISLSKKSLKHKWKLSDLVLKYA